MALDRLFRLMAEKKASDLFLSPGSAIQIKVNGRMVPVGQQVLEPANIRTLLSEVITTRQWQQFEDEWELNLAHGVSGVGSFRISVFVQRGSPSAVIRYIPSDIPRFDSLKLPPVLADVVMDKRGLVLVVGATGSGKSTTLASMLDLRNHQRSGHILTIEDPIEFNFRNQRSIVNQREIGSDSHSLEVALKNALRQAPDCILIGETRDAQTMSSALAYAQSGHLVLSTLHANNSYHALNRVISFYSPENRRALLADLATTLKCIICQRLVRTTDGSRVPAVEILMNTTHIAELIEQARVGDIKEAMEKSLAPGSQTFDQALTALVHSGQISREAALANSDSATNLMWLLDNFQPSDAAAHAKRAATGSGSPTAPKTADGTTAADGGVEAPKQDHGASFSEFLLNI